MRISDCSSDVCSYDLPSVSPEKMTGLWAPIVALVVACAILIVSRLGHWRDLRETINKGIFGFTLPLFNTATEVGYGAVIAGLEGFRLEERRFRKACVSTDRTRWARVTYKKK